MIATLTDLKILALDCQATGANPHKGHLLEIGWFPTQASAADNSTLTGLQAYLVSLPVDAVIPRPVERITGISSNVAATGISSKIVWERLVETAQQIAIRNPLSSCPLVIHFARFEKPFLRQLHQKHSPKYAFPFQIICTHEIAIRLLPELPRRGIRAIAGYFGHSMPELKRSMDHVIATAFIWKQLVGLLDTTCGVSSLDQLIDWLTATKPPTRSGRSFPMNPEVHLRLPDKPGIYRMLRAKNGEPLYIGKAKSLKQRVNSYFRQKTAHAEHTLEMLTQARELDFTLTGSALEAAVLESDEIKHSSPPYNMALRRRKRVLAYCTKDLCRNAAASEGDFTVGPLPAGRFIKTITSFGLWLTYGMQVNNEYQLDILYAILALPPDFAPEIDCLKEGFKVFRKTYSSRLTHPSALRVLTALGAAFWRKRLQADALAEMVTETENDDKKQKESDREHVWTPEAVVHTIENMIRHSAHLIRRARWFCMLSESSLTWASAGQQDNLKILVVFENGSVLSRKIIKTAEEIPVPPGCAKSFRSRQNNIDLITYDRLRVLTTELRRLVSEGRDIKLRLNPGVTLNRQEITKVLQWV
ncbi:MAG: GIY-YIG nuclease family protein [Desulfobacterales bacterium]|jgi:DNA polymerase-3 subunit epsilon